MNGNSQATTPYEQYNPYGPYTPACPYGQGNPYTGYTPNPVNPGAPVVPPIDYTTPLSPSALTTPIYPPVQQGPPGVTDAAYIPGFLAANIGKSVRAEFVLGTSQFVDKTGILVDVGVNFFVLQDINSRTYTMCDLYSVRFVTILYGFGTTPSGM